MKHNLDFKTFQSVFENSQIGIILVDQSGTIRKINSYGAEMFKYSVAELEGRLIEDLVPAELREKHVKYRDDYFEEPVIREMGQGRHLYGRCKDDSMLPVEISLSTLEEEGRKEVLAFVVDKTIQIKAQKELEDQAEILEQKVGERTRELFEAIQVLNKTNDELEKEIAERNKIEGQVRLALKKERELNDLKSKFISMASHEFRTPLGGIMTSSSLIERYIEMENRDKALQHCHRIASSVRNLTMILRDFLSLDKLDQGIVDARQSIFSIKDLLQEICEDAEETLDNSHPIDYEFTNGDPKVKQDQEMLRNIMTNLISNAFKYSPPRTRVEVRGHESEGVIHISVKDSGIGIPEEDQKHMFQRFFRADNVGAIKGTGLGLCIVKRYIEIMNGKISFESLENRGTTFRIQFPAELI